MGEPVQELACRVLPLAEEAGIGLGQGQQHGLQRLDQFTHLEQQPLVFHEVVQHHAHHLLTQLLAQLPALGLLMHDLKFGRLGLLLRLCGHAGALRQAAHHRLHQFQVLQRLEGSRHGVQEILRRQTNVELARQQPAQLVECHHGAGHRAPPLPPTTGIPTGVAGSTPCDTSQSQISW